MSTLEKPTTRLAVDVVSDVVCGPGDGANRTKLSKKSCTPKLVKAEPKQTGVNSPASTAS